ncbi:MAG: RNase H family protein [Candidatus Bipolaricaulis sp.]
MTGMHRVHFHWLAGHAGDAENERADALARRAAEGR